MIVSDLFQGILWSRYCSSIASRNKAKIKRNKEERERKRERGGRMWGRGRGREEDREEEKEGGREKKRKSTNVKKWNTSDITNPHSDTF